MACNNLGVIYNQRGWGEKAEAMFAAGVSRNPNGYSDAHRNLGAARMRRGNLKGAAESFEAAVQILENFEHPRIRNLQSPASPAGSGSRSSAPAAAATAAATSPLGAGGAAGALHASLGFLRHQLGDLTGAEESYEEALLRLGLLQPPAPPPAGKIGGEKE